MDDCAELALFIELARELAKEKVIRDRGRRRSERRTEERGGAAISMSSRERRRWGSPLSLAVAPLDMLDEVILLTGLLLRFGPDQVSAIVDLSSAALW